MKPSQACLFMEASTPLEELAPVVARHSSCQALFEVKDGWLRPVELPDIWAFDSDIASVLKYKGKTNERFTQMMINLAVCSGTAKGGGTVEMRF